MHFLQLTITPLPTNELVSCERHLPKQAPIVRKIGTIVQSVELYVGIYTCVHLQIVRKLLNIRINCNHTKYTNNTEKLADSLRRK